MLPSAPRGASNVFPHTVQTATAGVRPRFLTTRRERLAMSESRQVQKCIGAARGCCPCLKRCACPISDRHNRCSCANIGLISNYMRDCGSFLFAEEGRFFNSPVPTITIPPIGAFVGTIEIGTKYEDFPFAENLRCVTC
jgi:hypothetical protein